MREKKQFNRDLFELYFEQTWLQRHEAKIERLLELAHTKDERELILDLLKHFNYIGEDRLQLLLGAMANRICHELAVPEEKTQVVTTAIDNEPDSSQMLLQMLKNRLTENGFTKIAKRSRGHEAIKYCHERPNIIVVEEFSGTGGTIISRVTELNRRIQDKAKSKGLTINPRIVVCLLATMRSALERIKDADIEVYAEFEMAAGISQRIDPENIMQKKRLMVNIETRLDQARMQPFPSLGYGQAEALFFIQNGNPPNNNFPVFWWKHLKDGGSFFPLLERDEPNYDY
ncbi:phosphoribosyltransferase-like protein [Phaeobacter piscinae]|uniref:phosphoribosyltransferase-like protein n=1 Tax=Phaeobacter piscinae TaxID=1580596 RepID=UPI000BBEC3AA|nr:hypothetical protein [Phaeobacter piscinae]ATG40693.1 hypothetical protein PhaeoP14_02627 [Phaeobacter piscinae]